MYFISFNFKNLNRRPVRTGLTVLGLSVAVGAMTGLLGISHNFTHSIAETMEKRGVDLMVLAGGAADQLSSEMDESVVERIKKIDGVLDVDPALVELTDMET